MVSPSWRKIFFFLFVVLNNLLALVVRLLAIPVEVHGGQSKDQTQQAQKGISPSEIQLAVHCWTGEGHNTACDAANDVVGCEGTGGVGSEGVDEVSLYTCLILLACTFFFLLRVKGRTIEPENPTPIKKVPMMGTIQWISNWAVQP